MGSAGREPINLLRKGGAEWARGRSGKPVLQRGGCRVVSTHRSQITVIIFMRFTEVLERGCSQLKTPDLRLSWIPQIYKNRGDQYLQVSIFPVWLPFWKFRCGSREPLNVFGPVMWHSKSCPWAWLTWMDWNGARLTVAIMGVRNNEVLNLGSGLDTREW